MSAHMSSMHRDRAQAAHDPADAERVGDRLAQAVLLRHLEVGDGARLVAADLDHVDRVVGAVERGAPVGGGGDLRLGASSASATRRATSSDVASRSASMSNSAISRLGELIVSEDVAEQVAREHRAARADEDDLGHTRRLSGCGRLTPCGGCGSGARGTGSRTPRTRARRAPRRSRRRRRAPRRSLGLRPSSARASRGPRR